MYISTYIINKVSYNVYHIEEDWYDIFIDETGECINEGEPFYEEPTIEEITLLLKDRDRL